MYTYSRAQPEHMSEAVPMVYMSETVPVTCPLAVSGAAAAESGARRQHGRHPAAARVHLPAVPGGHISPREDPAAVPSRVRRPAERRATARTDRAAGIKHHREYGRIEPPELSTIVSTARFCRVAGVTGGFVSVNYTAPSP